MSLPLRSVLIPVACLAAAAGCAPKKAPPPPPPPPTVTACKPLIKVAPDVGEYTGFVEALQRVEIRPQIKGKLVKVHVPEGTEIASGRLLYEIDPREYQETVDGARAALDRAVADERRAAAEDERAKATLARLKRLGGGISMEELDVATAAEKTAVAAVGQARAAIEQAKSTLDRAELDLSYTKIYSPISGRVSRTFVTEGNLVGYSEPTLLTVMVDQDPIYVYFDVPERDAIEYEARVKPLRTLLPLVGGLAWRPLWSDGIIPVEVGVETEDGYPHTGVLNFREPRFESETGTVRLRAVLDNPDRTLSSGMYARIRFPLSPARPRLTVAAAAVLSDQRGRFVYTVQSDKDKDGKPIMVAVPKTITLGPRLGDLVVVETGLTADDVVVIDGVQKVRPKAQLTPDLKPMPES